MVIPGQYGHLNQVIKSGITNNGTGHHQVSHCDTTETHNLMCSAYVKNVYTESSHKEAMTQIQTLSHCPRKLPRIPVKR